MEGVKVESIHSSSRVEILQSILSPRSSYWFKFFLTYFCKTYLLPQVPKVLRYLVGK